LGIEYRYVEASSDTTKINAALEDAMNDPEVDIIIQSQGDFTETLPEVATIFAQMAARMFML